MQTKLTFSEKLIRILRIAMFILFGALHHSALPQDTTTIARLTQELQAAPSDTSKIELLISLGNEYDGKNRDKSISYFKNAIDLSASLLKGTNNRNSPDSTVYKDLLGLSKFYLGIVYQNEGDYKTAMSMFSEAIRITKELDNKSRTSQIYNNIGNVYIYKGDYSIAIENYQKSLAIAEEINDPDLASKSLNNICIIYFLMGKFKLAIEYNDRALNIAREIGDSVGIAYGLNNMGNIHIKQKNYTQAENYYLESLEINRAMKHKMGISRCLNNLGIVYKNSQRPNKSIDKYEEAVEINTELNDIMGLASNYVNLGVVYTSLGRYYKAILSLNKCLEYAGSIGAKNEMKDAYLNLSICYEKLKKYDKAYDYHRLYFIMNDSIYNEESTSQLNELEAKYQNEKKQHDINLLNKERELQKIELQKREAEVAQKNTLQYGLFILIGLILLVIIWILRSNNQKRKANHLLSQQKEEIETKNQNLKVANAEILQKNEEIQAQSDQLSNINQELHKLSIVASETENSIIIANAQGEIEWVNHAFTRIMGYRLDEYIRYVGRTLMDVSGNENIRQVVEECIESKKPGLYIALSETKSGERIWFQTTLTPVLGNDGNILYLVAIDSDVSRLKEAEMEISCQNELIMEKNEKINESIEYACLIQRAVLPPESEIAQLLPEHFLLFRPKDVVSGDFYWITEHNSQIIIIVADCTGHGVPGAFMSMLGIAFLNEIIVRESIIEPDRILNNLRDQVINSMRQTGREEEARDGMVAGLCTIDKKNRKLMFSGAKTPLMYMHKGQLVEIQGDRMPVSIYYTMDPFTAHTIDIDKEDVYYLFSDGYAHQFGGVSGEKFQKSELRKVLSSNYKRSMIDQKAELERSIDEWQNHTCPDTGQPYEQVDDIIVFGFKA